MPSHERKLYHPDDFRQWPRPRYTGYGNGWLQEYGFSSEMKMWKTGSHLDVFLFLSSLLLFFGSRPGIHGVRTGFTTRASHSMGGGVSACAGCTKRSPLRRTDRLWDLRVRTIPYVEWLFHSVFPLSSLHLYWLWQHTTSAPKEGDNVTAWLHVTCPGPGTPRSI